MQIFKLLIQKIELPQGYSFVKADEEKDAQRMTKMNNRKDFKHNEVLLRRMPYALVKQDGNNEPIAFELLDPSGIFRLQYTHPDHRGQGLGNAVERKLARKALKLEMIPYKFVEVDNTNVIEASLRCPYWTRWEHNGQSVEINILKPA
uniref:Glycine N-acyltransferase-like protein n=1 Tax=Acrobeloides nanus TaxID=290746 RepID=A0A914CTG0_9BILA